MMIETKSIRDVLITSLEQYRIKSKMASGGARASLDGVVMVLENLLMFINKADKENEPEEAFMVKLQNELVAQVVMLEDIEMRRRSSELEDKLKAVIEGLQPGQAALMSDKIKYGHLSTKLSQMRSKKQVPENIHVVKRGDKTYIVKQMA